MWVQLLAGKTIPLNGEARRYHPGDWVDVGKQTALAWIAAGQAKAGKLSRGGSYAPGSCVSVHGGNMRAELVNLLAGVETFADGSFEMRRPKTLFYDVSLNAPRVEFWPIGFNLLDKWDIACPLASYDVLARDIGSEQERVQTERVIRDLRVPFYDTRLIFATNTKVVREMLREYAHERQAGDERLAFLRCLYVYKPCLLALPNSWIARGKVVFDA